MLKSSFKNTSHIRGSLQKCFSSNIVGKSSAGCPFLNADVRTTINKLVLRDFQHFVDQSQKEGLAATIDSINEAASKFDTTTARGREVILARDDALTRLAYYNRSVEEHENVSVHICEKEVYRTYRLHLEELEANHQKKVSTLTRSSNSNEQVLYRRTGGLWSSIQSQYLSPTLIFLFPTAYAIKNLTLLKLTLGAFAPSAVIIGSFLAASWRYNQLTGSSGLDLRSSHHVVSALSISNNTLNIKTFGLKGDSTHSININNVGIEKFENSCRRNPYYLITDKFTGTKYIVNVEGQSLIDEKALQFLANEKFSKNDVYDARSVVLNRQNLIDTRSCTRSSLETLARITLLREIHPNIATLSQEELYEQISLIPDSKVHEYLSNLNSKLNSALPPQDSLIVEIAEFFSGLGLRVEEAQQVTKHLVSSLLVKSLSDLKNISDQNFNDVFLQVDPNFSQNHPNFLSKVRVYFNKL